MKLTSLRQKWTKVDAMCDEHLRLIVRGSTSKVIISFARNISVEMFPRNFLLCGINVSIIFDDLIYEKVSCIEGLYFYVLLKKFLLAFIGVHL